MFRLIGSLGFLQVAGVLINILRAKAFAVLLGPAGVGVIATIDQLVVSTCKVANLGMPFTALKVLSREHSRGESGYRSYFFTFLWAIVFISCTATLVVLVFISPNLESLDPQLAKYDRAIFIALLGIPATILLAFFVNVLASRQRSLASVLLNVFYSLVLLLAGVIGCWFGGIAGVYLITVPATFVLIAGVAVYMIINFKEGHTTEQGSVLKLLKSDKDITRIALVTYVAIGSYYTLLLVARYQSILHLGEEAAGYLHASLAIALSVAAVLTPASTLYFTPNVNRVASLSEKVKTAKDFLPRLMFLYCIGVLPVLMFPKTFLWALFSDSFIPAAPLLVWFLVWQFFVVGANIFLQLLLGLDDSKGYCLITVTGNLTAMGLCLPFTKAFGLTGIGAAFVFGSLIAALLAVTRLHKKFGSRLGRFLLLRSIIIIVGVCTVAVIGLSLPELSPLGLMARVVTILIYFILLWLALPATLSAEIRAAASRTLRH